MPRSKRTVDRHAAGLARALAFAEANLDTLLDAGVLARQASMSKHHFHRVFAARLGCTVGDYVSAIRLRRACALLVTGREPVLEVALAVGYESAQALAKAMRRELDATPTEVRRGDRRAWARLLDVAVPEPRRTHGGTRMIEPTRIATIPPGRVALTATARGMVGRTLTRAARAAWGELYPALERAGALGRVRTWLAFSPDDPRGPDDPDCRYVAAVLFDATLDGPPPAAGHPAVALEGTLEWRSIEAGPAALFLHRGPYDRLHETWRAIYSDWAPAGGRELRDAAPFEVMLNDPARTAPADLLTEIWIPIVL
jgi:AraC family transcriptional regulator